MSKPHGSNPRARRLARNGEAKLARAEKQAARRAPREWRLTGEDMLREAGSEPADEEKP